MINLAIDKGEGGAEVYEHLGDILKALNDHDGAKKAWQTALEIEPQRDSTIQRINQSK